MMCLVDHDYLVLVSQFQDCSRSVAGLIAVGRGELTGLGTLASRPVEELHRFLVATDVGVFRAQHLPKPITPVGVVLESVQFLLYMGHICEIRRITDIMHGHPVRLVFDYLRSLLTVR
jgi:hypothetical protein